MGFPNIWNSIPRPNLTHLATYICVYMCARACVRACRCVCAWAHTHIYIYIHTHKRTHTHTHTGMGAHTHVCIHVCAYIQLIVSHISKIDLSDLLCKISLSLPAHMFFVMITKKVGKLCETDILSQQGWHEHIQNERLISPKTVFTECLCSFKLFQLFSNNFLSKFWRFSWFRTKIADISFSLLIYLSLSWYNFFFSDKSFSLLIYISLGWYNFLFSNKSLSLLIYLSLCLYIFLFADITFSYLRYFSLMVGWLFGWLFGIYGISTFVGHSTPNSVYIYIHIQPKISKRISR